jgi:hypothetical protein
VVEQAAVNRWVGGSNPSSGATSPQPITNACDVLSERLARVALNGGKNPRMGHKKVRLPRQRVAMRMTRGAEG